MRIKTTNSRIFYALALSAGMFCFTHHVNAQTYCTPTFLDGCTNGENINDFILTGENGTEIEDLNTGCSANSYDDKTSLPAVQLYQGEEYTVELSTQSPPDADPLFGGTGMNAAIWIDFDDNGTFEPLEKVGVYNDFLDLTTSPITITIPADANVGTHRLRVVLGMGISMFGQGTNGDDLEPCPGGIGGGGLGLDLVGEVHDYSVDITEPGASNCDNFLVDLGADTTICYNAALVLDAYIQGATSYVWSTGSTSSSINITDPGLYQVAVSNGTCDADASISVSVMNGPQIDDISVESNGGLDFTFVATGATDVTNYAWSFGDGTTGTGQTVDHTYTSGGNYTVMLTISNECGDKIESTVVNTNTAGIETEGFLNNSIAVYPNPAKAQITVNVSNAAAIEGVMVSDVLGKVVLQKQYAKTNQVNMDVSALPRGTYFATISTDQGVVIKKILIVE